MKKRKTDTPGKGRTKGAVAALVAALAVFAVMLQLERTALADYEKGVIYVAAARIPKGQKITSENAEQYLEQREIDRTLISAAALNDPEQIEGLLAKIDIEEGVFLCRDMFLQEADVLKELEEPVIAAFRSDDLYQVVGGVLRGGDRIHIYSVSEEKEALLTWENIFVESVYDQNGLKIEAGDVTSCAARINVYLDKKDVEQFYSNLAAGALRVVKVCR